MKRISSLILAAAFVFGSMGAAQAIDTKIKGIWDFTFGWGVHTGFQDSKQSDNKNKDSFEAVQRVRSQINFIASENLQAVLEFEIGKMNWGIDKGGKVGDGSGAGIDADGINIKTRRAYLDWLIPNSGISVRMGLQALSLPMATRFYNPVFSATAAGISTSYKFDDTFAVTAFWARPFYTQQEGLDDSDKTDMFGLALPISLDGVRITPWGTYARVGNKSGAFGYINNGNTTSVSATNKQTAEAWWAGLGINVDLLDPLTFALDAMYGQVNRIENGLSGTDTNGASGWFLTSTLDYKLDWATPGLFGWYSTGDSNSKLNKHRYGRMPVLGLDDGFNPTSFGFAGNMALSNGRKISGSGMGTWGIGVQVADMSFIKDLSHIVRVAYVTGTNNSNMINGTPANAQKFLLNTDALYLTTKDHALEVNFISKYKIYDNLTATFDVSYINLDLNKNTWTSDYVKKHDSDAWKAEVNLRYNF